MLPDYPFATPPAAGETFQVSPGIHWLRMPLPFALNHINLWLLEDDDGWVIVDTGFALDAVKECWQQVLARLATTACGGRISRIIDSTLPFERDLSMRDSPEFAQLAHEVREALAEGHHEH